MKINTLLSIIALCAVSVRAEVIIYTQSYSEIVTGDDKTTTTSFGGYMLTDTSKSKIYILDTRTVNKVKKFTVSSASTFDGVIVDSGVNKHQYAFTIPTDGTGGIMMKGQTSVLNLGGTGIFNTFDVAKTLTVSGFFLSTDAFGTSVHEFKGNLTYDSKNTVAANKIGNDIETTLTILKTALSAKGYSLVSDWTD